jgi:hypothetical protein
LIYHLAQHNQRNQHKQQEQLPSKANMSNNIDSWRKITGIGHGKSWGAPTSYTSDACAWGEVIKQTVGSISASPSPSPPSEKRTPSASPDSGKSTLSKVTVNKGFNAEAKVFVPGASVGRE